MATEPRYAYDPVTQTYKLLPPEQAPVTGLGSLYNAGGDGNGVSASSGGRGPGQGVSSAAQNIGLGAMAYGNMLGGFMPGGTLVGMAGNAIAGQQVDALADAQANLGAMDAGPGRGMGIATVSDPEGNTFGFSSPSTIAAADQATFGLASMNAQTAAQNQAQSQQAAVANTAASVADAMGVSVSEAADAAQDAANAADAAAAGGGGGGGDGAGGGGAADGTAGVGSESGHAADGNNASDGPSGGEGEKAGGPIYLKRYNQGGVASLANKVQSQGRGQDKMLVHMTPKEVAGLQYLAMAHGGSLTINPKTGLVEAGFLSSILPMVAGAALNVAVPGLGAAMGGFAIPALVGGANYLMNPKQGLMGGLMAGLGAYGGMNLSNALITPESIGAQNMAAQGGYDELINRGFMDQSGQLLNPATNAPYLPAELAPGVANPAAATQTAQLAYNPEMVKAAQGGMDLGAQKFAQMGTMDRLAESAKTIANQPISATVSQLGGPMKAAATVAPLASAGLGALAGEEEDEGKPPYEAKIRPFKYDPGRKTAEPDFRYRTGERGESTAEQTYFTPTFTPVGVYKAGEEPAYGTYNEGGITALKRGGMEEGGYVVAADVVAHLGNGSTKAGQKLLKRKLGGVPLNGPGDGMSDSISTHIEGKQPARVADGEVYIPASVARGKAKDLDRMMKRIRMAKTGKTKQAPEMNTAKFIPA